MIQLFVGKTIAGHHLTGKTRAIVVTGSLGSSSEGSKLLPFFDLTVFYAPDVACKIVNKKPIMDDGQDGAFKFCQGLFEACPRWNIEVVKRFI